jgi:hypothetical protein
LTGKGHLSLNKHGQYSKDRDYGYGVSGLHVEDSKEPVEINLRASLSERA